MRSHELLIVEDVRYVTHGRRSDVVVVEAGLTNQYFLQQHKDESQNYSLTGRAAITHHSSHHWSLQYPHCKEDSSLFSNGKDMQLALFLFVCFLQNYINKQNNKTSIHV